MRSYAFLFAAISVSLVFSGCMKKTSSEISPVSTGNTNIAITSGTLDHSDLSGVIQAVLTALNTEDFLTLAKFVGPHGLRFSPYPYVNTGTDVVMDTELVANAPILSRTFMRGAYDGSGEPIDLSVGAYFRRFVNDADWSKAPEVLYNQESHRGNTINNIAQAYPGKTWVEFYFTGFDAQYEGMDRKSLTLVFDKVDGQRQLIGVVHGQRTI